MPQSIEEWHTLKDSFTQKSSNAVMRGCVGAIDGLFQYTKCPSKKDCHGNQLAYFSGHYGQNGLNVQAVCNADLKFIYFGVVAPGKTPDVVAYERTGLHSIVENLPIGLYFVGDAAYTLTEHMLVPYTGSNRDNPDYDAFNFFLSQLRIRIEMSFGLLTTKWSVLRTFLGGRLSTRSKILEACARLHNYVISHKIKTDFDTFINNVESEITPMPDSPLGWGYLPTLQDFADISGTSATRRAIVKHIKHNGYRRPIDNINRRRELQDLNLM